MSVASRLTGAAAALAAMPDAQVAEHLGRLGRACQSRGPLARARHRAEVDSLDLDWAAYQLGRQHQAQGDLAGAAHWYRMAAANDFADAALLLGTLLDTMAAERAAATGPGYWAQREELALVSDAARWYAEAYAAGHAEAAGRLDAMISRHDTRRTRAAGPPGAAAGPAAAGPGAQAGPAERGTGPGRAEQPPAAGAAEPDSTTRLPRCPRGGLDAVIDGSDMSTAAAHFRDCLPCQAQFLAQGGLLPFPRRPGA